MSIGQHIDTFMSVNDNELQWLHDRAKAMNSIVEIGSCKGRSTYALCSSGCPKVIAIDDFGCGTKKEFLENTKDLENLILYEMLSENAAPLVKSASMIFIDGMHDFNSVWNDLSLWSYKATKLICGHDFIENIAWTDVPKAVRDFFGIEPHLFETIWYYEVDSVNGIFS